MITCIGIDPGKSGGIAFVFGLNATAFAMPDPIDDIADIIHDYKGEDGCIAYVERAGVFPKQGIVSAFTFGTGYGKVLGILRALEVPTTIVQPKAWQGVMLAGVARNGRKEIKQASIETAKRLWPDLAKSIGRKDGISDALLIAEYGKRQSMYSEPKR